MSVVAIGYHTFSELVIQFAHASCAAHELSRYVILMLTYGDFEIRS